MKKYIIIVILLIIFDWANAQKFEFVKCISGDCQNGKGVAEVTGPSQYNEFTGTDTYTGGFKDGKMTGEASLSNNRYYYIGNFEENFFRGYGTTFQSKITGNVTVPDSTGWMDFCKWDEDGCNIRLSLQQDNSKVRQRYYDNKRHKKFLGPVPFQDEWIMQHVSGVIASGVRGYIPQYEAAIIEQKNVSAPKGQPVTLITWDCLADRDYFVTASATKNGNYTVMPFGGSVNYQVSGEDGAVVFEGPADRYWKPLKDGKYTFTVKFDQGQISGNGNLYVDGVVLSCSLRSRRLVK